MSSRIGGPTDLPRSVAIAGRVQVPTEAHRQSSGVLAASDPFAAFAQRIGHLPIWIWHGASDPSVDQSRTLVPVLQKACANVRYTEYPNTDHEGGAQKAYADPEMIIWLMAQRRK